MCAEICDALFDGYRIAGRPIYTYRDGNLKNVDTDRAMELDIFYPDKSFAVEFNGVQHYKDSAFFQSVATQQIARDNNKILQARKHGIILVSIPHTYTREQAYTAIRNTAMAIGLLPPMNLTNR